MTTYLISDDLDSFSQSSQDRESQSQESHKSHNLKEMKIIGSKVTRELLELINQLKVLHWQTTGYAEHKALDKLFDILNGQNDRWVETFMGKYDRVQFDPTINTISLKNKTEIENDKNGIIPYLKAWTHNMRNIRDKYFNDSYHSDLSNIFDEIFGDIDRTCYLLSLH